jgi:regulator of protease activity HflC (stomatin/prohibitin superfamily)
MFRYAVIANNKVINIIIADTKEDAEQASGLSCIELKENDPIGIDHELSDAQIKIIEKEKAKCEAEAKAAADALEAERIKALELELERARQIEAERLAVEEAAKPKPITGIFVKVEKN